MTLQPIVESHDEVDALPVLLRRFIEAAQAWEIKAGSASLFLGAADRSGANCR